ncbi:hypothetical protein KSS87_016022 [Heliosperma pusillum]|nr:hypothetical protein KSS87_016022 [Heliosperma pusillum]
MKDAKCDSALTGRNEVVLQRWERNGGVKDCGGGSNAYGSSRGKVEDHGQGDDRKWLPYGYRGLEAASKVKDGVISSCPTRYLIIMCWSIHFPRNIVDKAEFNVNEISNFREMGFNGGRRWMSTSKGRSMRSKVERRMQKEAGKTVKQIRQAKKLKLKLMTEEERLLYSLKRAKKKVALLLQKLKKYDLPELPPPRHDPELLTSEQLQAYKKIGFRNKNYCPVGVRGVFGGVVQNMHLHWKFHETVQVCCDNFPKEKIKEMASLIARLSGGIVVNIHNVKTIIMYRGRNYRQPKNLIPLNTLTKRKALFKARFEQALESQKLNIKKIEQQLRKKGISPDDPVAMASIQRVASTFFNAIDKKEGSPYVFRGDEESRTGPQRTSEKPEPGEDSDQEELDKFIAEIEDAADREWAEEEAAEEEEVGRIRYLNKDDSSGRFKPERYIYNDPNGDIRGGRGSRDTYRRERTEDSENEGDDDDYEESDASEDESHTNDSERDLYKPERTRVSRVNRGPKHSNSGYKGMVPNEESGSEKLLDDLDDVMWDSDPEKGFDRTSPKSTRIRGGSQESGRDYYKKPVEDESEIDEVFSESEIPIYEESDDEALESSALKGVDDDYSGAVVSPYYHKGKDHSRGKRVSGKKNDEIWDSD